MHYCLQGHLGESPFEAGSWTKSQFVAQASPWQPALRGSHVRVNVSAVAYSRVSRKNILCYLKVRPHRTRSAAADCGLCPLRNVTF